MSARLLDEPLDLLEGAREDELPSLAHEYEVVSCEAHRREVISQHEMWQEVAAPNAREHTP